MKAPNDQVIDTEGPIATSVPLVVDLDGTLLATDLLVESAFRLFLRNPFCLILFPLWLLRGRQVLKYEIAKRVELDPTLLPYDEEFVKYIGSQHRAGRQIVLATAATRQLAERVFEHFAPVFERLVCSDESTNLKGRRKRDALVRLFGDRGFDYAGNDVSDMHVWQSARKAIVVRPSGRARAMVGRLSNVERTFPRSSSVPMAFARSLRVHQWLKNTLVFVPLVAAHKWNEIVPDVAALAAFVSFCLVASGVYQINDILDLDHDRAHPKKRRRPLASGELSLVPALLFAMAALVAAFGIAWPVSLNLCIVLAIYAGMTTAYSFWLKAHPIIDVVVLACLYTLRVIGGAAAIGVALSYWLTTFSMFVFLSLALIKRCAELTAHSESDESGSRGRGYIARDLPVLTGLGTAFGAGAVLVLALYINADVSSRNYSRPEVLWLLCPTLVFWLGHLWLKTGRAEMHEDPVLFAARNRSSLAALGVGLLVILAAGA